MRVFKSLSDIPKFTRAVFTQGTFDGVHLGHKVIIERIVRTAREIEGESVLLTFFPHPRLLLYPDDNDLKLLQTMEEKTACLADLGLDNLVILPFTKEFSAIPPDQFITDFLVNTIGVSVVVVGYDHRFGHNREGDITLLRKMGRDHGFKVQEIAAEDINHIAISSTKIRKALESGDIRTATTFLGRYYSITGTVVHGRKLGRDLGFPTANIELSASYKLVPAMGVYAVQVKLRGEIYGGMMNIGQNPTIQDKGFSIEVNLFNFADQIYGEELEVLFVERMRDELKFDGLKPLVDQLKSDKVHAEKILNHL